MINLSFYTEQDFRTQIFKINFPENNLDIN